MSAGSSSDEDPDLIERIEAGEPPRSPEEAHARVPYERLMQRMRDLGDIDPPTGWEDRAVARWSVARRKRRLGVVVGATTALALAAVIVLRPCAVQSEPRLELAAITAAGTTHRGEAAMGDVLRARARIDRANVELRIYLQARLVARCPGSTACQRDSSSWQIEWTLIEAGSYEVVVLWSDSRIPAGDGTLDRDLLEARGAGAGDETQRLTVSP